MSQWKNTIVLVTGATGFLGRALTRRLVAEGASVRALARNRERAAYLNGLANTEIVFGDISNPNAMIEAAAGCEVVFHVAAAMGGPLEKQQRVNVDGTRNVAEAAASAGASRLVHVSSIAVYGYRTGQIVTEDSPLMPGPTPYNITKAQAEQKVREVCEKRKLGFAIIRPGLIYGPGSHMWTSVVFRLARLRPTPFIEDGSGSTFPIFVDDVVDMMLVLARHPQAVGQAFNCTPDPAPTWREYIGHYQRIAGHSAWIGFPVWPVRAVASLAEALLRVRREPQDVAGALDFVLGRRTYSMDKARYRLGWEPCTSLPSGVACCGDWLCEIGLLGKDRS